MEEKATGRSAPSAVPSGRAAETVLYNRQNRSVGSSFKSINEHETLHAAIIIGQCSHAHDTLLCSDR